MVSIDTNLLPEHHDTDFCQQFCAKDAFLASLIKTYLILLTGGFNLLTLKKTQCSFPGQGFGVNLTSLYNVDPRQLAGSILVYKILTRGRGE